MLSPIFSTSSWDKRVFLPLPPALSYGWAIFLRNWNQREHIIGFTTIFYITNSQFILLYQTDLYAGYEHWILSSFLNNTVLTFFLSIVVEFSFGNFVSVKKLLSDQSERSSSFFFLGTNIFIWFKTTRARKHCGKGICAQGKVWLRLTAPTPNTHGLYPKNTYKREKKSKRKQFQTIG